MGVYVGADFFSTRIDDANAIAVGYILTRIPVFPSEGNVSL